MDTGPMIRGKLIVLEGGDGAGKTVQVDLLHKRIPGLVQVFEFPRYYTSRAGKLVGECLVGKHGDFLGLSPYLASLSYTLDRVGAKAMLTKALAEGIVICNRYTPSNIAHQAAKISDTKEREAFIEFLEGLEYGEMQLPEPDIVLYLHMPADIASKLSKNKKKREYLEGSGETEDQHERDLTYQEKVVRTYLEVARSRSNWFIIECAGSDNTPLPPHVIQEQIWRIVEPCLCLSDKR